MSTLVISASLNPSSRSRVMARAAHERLRAGGGVADWLDLRDLQLPLCDGGAAYAHPGVATASAAIAAAGVILLACPIYNYWVNAAAKNLIELTGKAWTEKRVGFLCSAGGANSYLAVLGFGNALMADFRCHIIPRWVYAVGDQVRPDGFIAPEISERIARLAEQALIVK